ncbi:MAG: hypothetical protein GX893_07980 [Firmicutes bacterium]|nr:hypothetical protein [Bacillota bacterium]
MIVLRPNKNISTAVFLLFLTSISLLQAVAPKRVFSDTENRMLQQKAVFSWDKILSGKYMKEIENYLSDQFVFRDSWVRIKNVCEILLQKKDNNGVYFGKEGYLLQKPGRLNLTIARQNIAAINEFAADTAPLPVYLLLVPNSVQLLEDKLPPFASATELDKVRQLVSAEHRRKVHFLDLYPLLVAHRKEDIYYKTDHHWTTRAAFYAYQELARVMKFKALSIEDFSLIEVSDSFYGALSAKSGHFFSKPDTIFLFQPLHEIKYQVEYVDKGRISSSLYEFEHLKKRDQYSVFLDGNHALIKITTQIANGKKLLVVKDSFAHCLIPFLINHFEQIHILDLRYYHGNVQNYCIDNEIDEILCVYNTLTFAEERFPAKLAANLQKIN